MAGKHAKYLITGAQGFVGRYLCAYLLASNSESEVLGTGRSPELTDSFTHTVHWGVRPVRAPLPIELLNACWARRSRYVAVDLSNRQMMIQLLTEFEPDVVVHLAAGLRGDPPERLFKTNVEGTLQLLRAIAESGVALGRLLLCSSGGVYDAATKDDLPLRETSPCRPVDMYSASKLASEHFSRIQADEYGIPAVWARVFNVLGPGQDERHVCGKLAAQVSAIVAQLAPPAIEVFALDTTRDFIDVRDVALALVCLAEKGEPGACYNVGTGRETSIRRVLETLLQLACLESTVHIEQKPSHGPEIVRHFADIQRLLDLGFQPRYDLRESVADLLEYYTETVSEFAESLKVERS